MSESQRTLNQIREIRLQKLKELRKAGINPFPYGFKRTQLNAEIQACSDDQLPDSVQIAGRVISIRRMGKASFAHLQDETGRQQIYVKRDLVGEKDYDELFKRVDLGDILGCTGRVFRTRTGEITVEANELVLLTKSLRPLPNLKEKDGEVFNPFEDKENRYRKRYLDLIANPEVKDVFRQRAKIIAGVRRFLESKGYLEVETPALQPIYGGASARPFTTYHNALEQRLYLRIADELYLKRLIIGGFERVFEIAKNFRNEGMDRDHNPEFTSLEFYEAYADYFDMQVLTESLVRSVAEELGMTQLTYNDHVIDLAKPFKRLSMFDLLRTHAGGDLEKASLDELYALAVNLNIDLPKSLNYGQVLDKIFSLTVEPQLIQPTFVVDYPKAISPLAKGSRAGDEFLVERFELFIGGMEFANAFSELNDPLDQRERLESQAALREKGDEEAQVVDEDFIEALEYGMPPTGGVGIGIDRLVMLYTGQRSIKDVVLFPAMRPLQS